VLGWEWASQIADAEWANKARDILEWYFSPAERVGPNGFGNYPEMCLEEWAGVIRDPFKSRLTGDKEMHATFTGMSIDMIGTELRPVYREINDGVDSDFNGTLDTVLDSSINMIGTILGKIEGPITWVELEFKSYHLEDGVVVQDKMIAFEFGADTELGKLPDIYKDMMTDASEVWGSFSIEASLRKSTIIDMEIEGDLLWISMSLSAKLKKRKGHSERHILSGSINDRLELEIIVGDKVINEHESFRMFAGNTVQLDVTVLNADGTVYDMNDVTTITWLLLDRTSGTTLSSLTLGNGIQLDTAHFEILIPESATANRAGEFYHECEVTTASGGVSTIFAGTVSVAPTHI